MRILITGAGGPASICVYQAIKNNGFEIFMADMNSFATGLHFVPDSHKVLLPAGKAEHFATTLLAICQERGITILVPTVDAELLQIASIAANFEEAGIRLLMPTKETLLTCLDKYELLKKCAQTMPIAPFEELTTVLREQPMWAQKKVVVKPKTGAGSRDVFILNSIAECPTNIPKEEFLVQTFAQGKEYTVDILANSKKELCRAVIRERIHTDSGVSICGKTVKDETIINYIAKVVAAVGLTSVANIQVIKTSANEIHLIEINPRFAGGLALSIAAGVNIPLLALEQLIHTKDIAPDFTYEILTMYRYYQELFVADFPTINAEFNR